MLDWYLERLFRALWLTSIDLAGAAVFFAGFVLLLRRRRIIDDARRIFPETKTNLAWAVVDVIAMMPLVTAVGVGVVELVSAWRIRIFAPTDFVRSLLPVGLEYLARPIAICMAIFVGEFIRYWWHRMQHMRWYWPVHAIHHSDREMTWLTLWRGHPIERLTTALVDVAPLAVLGFAPEAVAAGSLIRHYSGFLLHANLPWTFGPWGKLLVSPAMHRWHHARDRRHADRNFGSLISIFDRMFGTYCLPGPCHAPLGIREDDGPGAWAQFKHPFKVWIGARKSRPARSPAPAGD